MTNPTQPADGMPERWQLVPVEPTREMMDAYLELRGKFQSARADWAAMLAAAPKAPPMPDWPHVGADEQGNATLEWWHGERKITIYLQSPPGEQMLKVWGCNVHDEMANVPTNDANAVRAAFDWLAQGFTKE